MTKQVNKRALTLSKDGNPSLINVQWSGGRALFAAYKDLTMYSNRI